MSHRAQRDPLLALVRGLLALCFIAFLRSGYPDPGLWPEQEQRVHVGTKLFPACLSADQDLADKTTPEGELRLLVVHRDALEDAKEVAEALQRVGSAAGLPLRVEILQGGAVARYSGGRVAGIFLATPNADEGQLPAWPGRFHALVFSPFLGDVERGAVAGLQVTDRILPAVNLPQAARAGVRFKPFFLKVAKIYD